MTIAAAERTVRAASRAAGLTFRRAGYQNPHTGEEMYELVDRSSGFEVLPDMTLAEAYREVQSGYIDSRYGGKESAS